MGAFLLGSSRTASRPSRPAQQERFQGRVPIKGRKAQVVAKASTLWPLHLRGSWLVEDVPVLQPELEDKNLQYGAELSAEQWNAWSFDPLRLSPTYLQAADTDVAEQPAWPEAERRMSRSSRQQKAKGGDGDFFKSDLPRKLGILVALVLFSRLGVYLPLPGVDVKSFQQSVATGGGLLGYIDTLSGGSISRVGVFSLGIVPYINASIVLQLLSTAFPYLKTLQREEGAQGRAQFQVYQRYLALAFAAVQGSGQLFFLRQFAPDFSPIWFASNLSVLVAGAMVLIYVSDQLTELKLGNGTSILITANIASALPTSVGAALQSAASKDQSNLAVYAVALFATTLGVVYVQEAERKIPMNYASRYRNTALEQQSYLPFKVNATGVMPVIFSSTLLSLPTGLARSQPWLAPVAATLGPTGPLFLPVNVALIAFFNYYYTFLQLEPKDLADQLKRQGASIPAVRPGRATTEYITTTLQRMSILGSAFLGALAAAPTLVEGLTKLQAFRGFAGTSILILVGVATDTARKVKAEQAMQRYGDVDSLYDDVQM